MTHWKSQFNYQWLGAYSLPEGKDIILTIKEMKREKVVGNNGNKELLLVAYFAEDVKPMVVNKTNCKTLEKLFKTPIIESWVGKQIQVGSVKVDAFGDKVDALRVRSFAPNATQPLITVQKDTPIYQGIIDALQGGFTMAQVKSKYKLTREQEKELKAYEIS